MRGPGGIGPRGSSGVLSTGALEAKDRGARKEALRALLLSRTWADGPVLPPASGRLLRMLVGFLQAREELLRWRAVEALGHVASRGGDDEAVREAIRSLFWGMNDESGNLFRMAPEAIGAILLARQDLRGEFAPLLPLYLNEEPFEEGALWALCLLAGGGWRPEGLSGCRVRTSLLHPGPRRRGLALRLCRLLGISPGPGTPPADFDDYDLSTGVLAPAHEAPLPTGSVC